MLVETLKILFKRDLSKLETEIGLYRNEEKIWYSEKSIANSAGNLCLHLIGNLNTYVGAQIGKTDYIRNREQEFSLKNIPQAKLLGMIKETITVVDQSLNKITDAEMENEYPLLVLAEKTSYGYFLVHLATHLTYHLGQVNYHRRLLDS